MKKLRISPKTYSPIHGLINELLFQFVKRRKVVRIDLMMLCRSFKSSCEDFVVHAKYNIIYEFK